MALWISMIIFCMTTEARLHVPHNVNKSKSISRTKFVKVLLWNEFLPHTHNFIAGLVRSMNIAVLSGRKSQHGDSGLTPFIQNSMQIEKKKRFAWETICFWKKGCWVFVIVKNLNNTALQPILGFTEVVSQDGESNPPPPKKMAILKAQYFYIRSHKIMMVFVTFWGKCRYMYKNPLNLLQIWVEERWYWIKRKIKQHLFEHQVLQSLSMFNDYF